jgi:outer membrane lipoprotein-sorting protein
MESGTKQPAAAVSRESSAAVAFRDEPAAHALYDQMREAMWKAHSLSYASHVSWEMNGKTGDWTYRARLKKPNYFRVETESTAGTEIGILVGDGRTLWIYWPHGRPEWEGIKESEADQKTRATSYMTKPAPPGGISIWHEMPLLGAGFPVIEPSAFHGHPDSLEPYVDGVKSLGTDTVGSEDCDRIEVSLAGHQRSWYLWLSKRDHLPRRAKEIVRLSSDIVKNEEWSSVTVNGEIPNAVFAWKPPPSWTEWRLPRPEDLLLRPGTKAPDFELTLADGKPTKMSDYRGQVVWFYIWRAG